MATSQGTIDFLTDQMREVKNLTSRKMFGEWALYSEGKIFALVCDDQLYMKPTQAAREFLSEVEERPPYPGAKNYFWISGDRWEDSEWLCELVRVSVAELPEPKPKKKK